MKKQEIKAVVTYKVYDKDYNEKPLVKEETFNIGGLINQLQEEKKNEIKLEHGGQDVIIESIELVSAETEKVIAKLSRQEFIIFEN